MSDQPIFLVHLFSSDAVDIRLKKNSKWSDWFSIPVEDVIVRKNVTKKPNQLDFQFSAKLKARTTTKSRDKLVYHNIFFDLLKIDKPLVRKGLGFALGAAIENAILFRKNENVEFDVTEDTIVPVIKYSPEKQQMRPVIIWMGDEYVYTFGRYLREYFIGSPVNPVTIIGTSLLHIIGILQYVEKKNPEELPSRFSILYLTPTELLQISVAVDNNLYEVIDFEKVTVESFLKNPEPGEQKPVVFLHDEKAIPVSAVLEQVKKNAQVIFTAGISLNKIHELGIDYFIHFIQNGKYQPNIQVTIFPQCQVQLFDYNHQPLIEPGRRGNHQKTRIALENRQKLKSCLCGLTYQKSPAKLVPLWMKPVNLPEGDHFIFSYDQDSDKNTPKIRVKILNRYNLETVALDFEIPRMIY